MLFLHSFLWEAVYSCFWLLLLVGQIVRYNPLCALKWLRVPRRNQIIIAITGNEQEFGISQHFGFFSFLSFVPSDSKVLTASYWSLSNSLSYLKPAFLISSDLFIVDLHNFCLRQPLINLSAMVVFSKVCWQKPMQATQSSQMRFLRMKHGFLVVSGNLLQSPTQTWYAILVLPTDI